jgi:hypothetical protein
MENPKNQNPKCLIDFLYKDIERINSFYAQIFQGLVLGVSQAHTASSGSSPTIKGGFGFVSAETTYSSQASQEIKKSLDPHDAKIVELFEYLDLPEYTDSVKKTGAGRLVKIAGVITVRQSKIIMDMLDAVKGAIPAPENFSWDAVAKLVEIMASGTEMELVTSRNEHVLMPIKSEYMSMSGNDIFKIYKSSIPGKWHAIGIADNVESAGPIFPVSNAAAARKIEKSGNLRAALNGVYDMAKTIIYSPEIACVVCPLVIYREIRSD